MSISFKSNADATLMSQRMGKVSGFVQKNIGRMSNGDRVMKGKHDLGALSVALKMQSTKKEINNHMSHIGNALSFLQSQQSSIKKASQILDRIGTLKIMHSDPLKSAADRENYDKEFKELAEELVFLKDEKFNSVSLFSETTSGLGLNLGSTKSVYGGVNSNTVISISQNVINYEDFKRITEAGAATTQGFGGLEVLNFAESGSVAQVETLSVGGRIAEGDVFTLSIREQTSLLETESDTTITYTATAADEAAADPNQTIRDTLMGLINANATLTGFLTVSADGTDSFKLTSNMAGDPFQITSARSTGSTGSMSKVQTQANISKVSQVDTAVINTGGNVVTLGDTLSVDINGTTISYTASATDTNSSHLAIGLSNAINASGVSGTVSASAAGGSFSLTALNPGTSFIVANETISIAAGPGESLTSSNTTANYNGQAQIEKVFIAPDNSAPGGGNIAKGDRYRVRINGTTFGVSAQAGESADSIRSRLAATITGVGVTASIGGSGEFILTADVPGTAFSLALRENLSPDSFQSNTTTANVSPFSIFKSMNLLTEMSAQNGGEQSRLHQANEHLVNQSVSYESTHSRITDVDFSRESTALAKNQLRLQVLQGFIGQVNLGAQTALSLLH